MSLKSKLVLSIVLIILFFGGLATYAVTVLVQRPLLANKKEELKMITQDKAIEVAMILSHSQLITKTIAVQSDVRDYLLEFGTPVVSLKDPLEQTTIKIEANIKVGQGTTSILEQDAQTAEADLDLANRILERFNDYNIDNIYSAIYLMNTDGLTLISTDASFVGKNYAFRDYFQQALLGESVVDMAQGITSLELGYYFAEPVKADSGKVIGVIVTKLKPNVVHEIIPLAYSDSNTNIFLVDDYGMVLYSTNSEKSLRSLGQLTAEQLKIIEEKKRFVEVNQEPLDYDMVLQALPILKQQAQIFEFYDEEDGLDEVIGASSVVGYPFYIMAEEGYIEHINTSRNLAYLIAGLVLLAAIFAAFFISLLASRFVKPLGQLKQFAQSLKEGHLGQRLQIKTQDEFGDLAQTMNQMAEKLQRSQVNIEKKVKERTQTLERLTQSMVGRELKMLDLKKSMAKKPGTRSKKTVNPWFKRFKEASSFEDDIVKDFTNNYLLAVEESNLSLAKKKKAKELLQILIDDSFRHRDIFKKLTAKYE